MNACFNTKTLKATFSCQLLAPPHICMIDNSHEPGKTSCNIFKLNLNCEKENKWFYEKKCSAEQRD